MKISQLSIFLENRVGVINEVVALLSEKGINMNAFSVAQASEFGILRLIVSDTATATEVLEAANYKVNAIDVISLTAPNTPGALAAVMSELAAERVFIEYMYAFSEGDAASIVIKPTDIDRCEEILASKSGKFAAMNPLYKF